MQLESLEQRRLFTVTANVIAGVLIVQGDASDNAVFVNQLPPASPGGNGNVLVTYADGSGSGLLSPEGGFAGIRGIVIATGDGNDYVELIGRGVDAVVTLGRGSDTAFIEAGDADGVAGTGDGSIIVVDAGRDDDVAESLLAQYDGVIVYAAGPGSDSGNVQALDGGRVAVEGGSGVDMFFLDAQGQGSQIAFSGGADDDIALIQFVGSGARITASGGAGNDAFTIVAVEAAAGDADAGYVGIDGGSGNDFVELGTSGLEVGGEVRINLGSGDDTAVVGEYIGVDALIVANGGAGTDTLTSALSPADPRLIATRFEV